MAQLTLRNNRHLLVQESTGEIEQQKRIDTDVFHFHLVENGKAVVVKRSDVLTMADVDKFVG